MGASIQSFATSAPARTRKLPRLAPGQRFLLERAIALIICAGICVMALGMVPHHARATPAGHAVAPIAAVA